MDSFTIFTWTLTATTILGTYLNSKQNKCGFLVWGLCNMLWLGVDFTRGIYAQAALYCIFIGFNVYGWMQWGKYILVPSEFHKLWFPRNTDELENVRKHMFKGLCRLQNENVGEITVNRQQMEVIYESVSYCTRLHSIL